MNLELIIFFIIKLLFVTFSIISIYDIATLHERDNDRLRNVQGITVGAVMIFIGIFLANRYVSYRERNIFKDLFGTNVKIQEGNFLFHSGLFMAITGISTIVINDKRMKEQI